MKEITYVTTALFFIFLFCSCSQSSEKNSKPLSVNKKPKSNVANEPDFQQKNKLVIVSSNMNNYILKLEKLNTVDGEAVYYAGEKGDFYKLYEVIIKEGTEKDFLLMLNNPKSTVRIMGALCLAQKNKEKYIKQIQSLYGDNTLVDFFPGGCCGGPEKVGDIAKQIMKNPKLLNSGL